VATSVDDTPLPPAVVMNGRQMAWAVYQGLETKLSDVYSSRVPGTRVHRIAHDVSTDQVALFGHLLAYTTSEKTRPPQWYSDVVVEDLVTGADTRLTTNDKADLRDISGRWLVWRRTSAKGLVFSARLPEGTPQVIAQHDDGWLEAGADFAAFVGATTVGSSPKVVNRVQVAYLASAASPTVLDVPGDQLVCVTCGLGVDGHQVLWATTSGDETIVRLTSVTSAP
jgi:hypothetical protein